MNITELENSLNRVHEWIRAADQKVSIFLAFQGVVITIIFPKVISWVSNRFSSLSWFGILVILIGFVCFLCGLIKSACALIPRLNKKTKERSLTYFCDIAKMDLNDFKKEIAALDEKGYENELVKQIHISAKIAKTKHEQFRDSIVIFLSGLVILGLVYVCLAIPNWYGN